MPAALEPLELNDDVDAQVSVCFQQDDNHTLHHRLLLISPLPPLIITPTPCPYPHHYCAPTVLCWPTCYDKVLMCDH